MSSFENRYSFIELVNSSRIQVPILQRDYVQGRSNDEVDEIRENFVSDLVNHISRETDKILPLDFIYGYLAEEFGKYDRDVTKSNIENILKTVSQYSKDKNFVITYDVADSGSGKKDIFIPLDGQQRLTTLFLLHFYVVLHFDNDISKISGLLQGKLSYKTRKSSENFLQKLMENKFEFDNNTASIAELIKDSSWFLKSWEKDPTVRGILVMLDEIERKYKNGVIGDFREKIYWSYHNLFVNPRIEFDFLNLGEHNIPEDIYLKMNSTGKPLSDYDNFKSWFSERVDELLENPNSLEELKHFEGWKDKLDQEWYNLFWTEDAVNSDRLFYSFIKSIFSFAIINSNEDEDQKKLKFEKLNSEHFIPLRFYEENNLVTTENVKLLFSILNLFTDRRNCLLTNIEEIWSPTFSNEKENTFVNVILTSLPASSLQHKIFFYAIFRLVAFKSYMDHRTFRKWTRIFRNLCYNTTIDNFSRLLNPINNLKSFINFSAELSLEKEDWIGGFDRKQVSEEYYKLQFENDDTINHFEVAENHFYLYGQIKFLIDWSMIKNQAFELTEFLSVKERIFTLFSRDNLHHKNHVIQRALLVLNDKWMPDKRSERYSFCKNTYANARERDENWRIIFNKNDKELLVLLHQSTGSTSDLLSNIEKGKSSIKDWRKFVLDDPSIISKCGQRLINWSDDGSFVRLLDKTKLSGFHTELRTWVLYKALRAKFQLKEDEDIKYQYVDSGKSDCRIRFIKSNFYIRFDRNTLTFTYEGYGDAAKKYYSVTSFPKELYDIPGLVQYIETFNLRVDHD